MSNIADIQEAVKTRNAAIPQELKNLAQWSGLSREGGRKQPAYPNGNIMAWGDSSHWCLFQKVSTLPEIEFIISPQSGIVGIDCDGCILNGVIHPLVQDWLARSQTYAEISESGTGIKFFLKARLPDHKKFRNVDVPWKQPDDDHAGIEVHTWQPFHITGNIVEGSISEVREAPEVLHEILTRFAPMPKRPARAELPTPGFDFWTFVLKHLDVRENVSDGAVIQCPWADQHTTPGDTARVWEGPPHTFSCFHSHCAGRTWQDVRTKFEPDAYTRKEQYQEYKPKAPPPTNGHTSEETGVLLSDVVPEQVRWIWPGRLALGKVHTLDGDPGIGKTLLMLQVGARITKNEPMPGEDQSHVSGGVVLVCLEDGLSDTLQPRLARVNADLERVVSIGYLKERTQEGKDYERPFTIDDLGILERAIVRVNAKLVIIDPVMAILGGRDTYKDNEVRAALAPLKEIAERFNCAIVLIRHIVKGGGEKAIYLGGGSIAFIGLARIGLLAVKNPDNQEQYIFANIKNNLTKESPKLLYSIASEEGVDERPYIKWEGESHHTDLELIKPASKNTGGNRQEIKHILEACKPIAKTVAELAEDIPDMTVNNLKNTLKRMYDGREIGKSARGAYYAF